MAVKDRRERERDETRGKIMDAARRLFAAEGFEAVSMRRIAEAIEYSPTAIYVHFKDKHDLFNAICSEDFLGLAHFVRDIANVIDPVERMRKLGLAYCKFGLEHPYHYRLMFMTPHQRTPDQIAADPAYGSPDADSWTMCRLAVQALADAGKLRPEISNPQLAGQTFWAGVHGVVSLEIIKGNDAWIEWAPVQRRCAAMVDSLISGICIDGSNPPPRRKRRLTHGGAK